ncbi:MAG: anthrone oxygenase family protein [Candidatus Polarisedimenticolia bacterium]
MFIGGSIVNGGGALRPPGRVLFRLLHRGHAGAARVMCALAMVTALARWPAPDAPWVISGGATFLIGKLGITALCNVPRNDALEAMPATDQDAPRSGRATYVSGRGGMTCEAPPRLSPPWSSRTQSSTRDLERNRT